MVEKDVQKETDFELVSENTFKDRLAFLSTKTYQFRCPYCNHAQTIEKNEIEFFDFSPRVDCLGCKMTGIPCSIEV